MVLLRQVDQFRQLGERVTGGVAHHVDSWYNAAMEFLKDGNALKAQFSLQLELRFEGCLHSVLNMFCDDEIQACTGRLSV